MSSDGFFSDELDSALLAEADAIEAAHVSPPRAKPAVPAPRLAPPVISIDDSDDYDDSCNFDDADFQTLDTAEVHAYAAGPSISSHRTMGRTSSMTFQRDLFGNIVTPGASTSKPASAKSAQPTLRAVPRGDFGGAQKKIKHWDHTEYAKSGWKKRKSSKGKGRATGKDGEDADDVQEPRLPVPFISEPMKLQPDPLAMKHWIYPLNKPKRDYQFNIVKHCLFENTLVALPTGLGKTFIAGVVMLNYYNWFPEGKVVFVAPSKPLVAQQVQACHKVCGIPGTDAAELTGEVPPSTRERLWAAKRVIYLTPQTLINDLSKNVCDPKSIVLVVVDEAHKGTGDYAYAQVVRFMMATNPHHRVLALTATPGGKPEAVQAVVDSLHISRIEIRNEDSLDLAPYLHKKTLKQHVLPMPDSIIKIRNMIVKLMEPKMKRLQQDGLLRGAEPARMHSFRPQAEMKTIMTRPDKMRLAYAYQMLSALGSLARALGYLVECSVNMCYSALKQVVEEMEEKAKTKKVSAGGKVTPTSTPKLKEAEDLRTIMKEIDIQRGAPGSLPLHPKLVELKNLVIQHFGKLAKDPVTSGDESDGAKPATSESRVMVFASFRQIVDEIVDVLNQERPLIRAMKLVGQSGDKQGNAGQNQKAQQAVLERFKAGEGNVLVATSIGEEGLDIGEIDMVICYDAQKTPIRMLQRVGRTGRKGDGYVHILMAEGREDQNWNKSEEAYKEVQRTIVQADQLELFADVPRLLPDHTKPVVHEQVMDIEEYRRENSRKTSFAKSPKAKTAKRKRNDDIARNIPAGASTGFTNVGEMLRDAGATKKGKAKTKTKARVFDPCAADDDETDAEIEAGLFGPTRSGAESPPVGKSRKAKKLSTSASRGSTNKTAKVKSVQRKEVNYVDIEEPITFSQKGRDDSDDEVIEAGPYTTNAPKHVRHAVHSLSPDGSLASASHEPAHLFAQSTPTLLSPQPSPPPHAHQSPDDWSSPQSSRLPLQPSPTRPAPTTPNYWSPTQAQYYTRDAAAHLRTPSPVHRAAPQSPDYWSPTQAQSPIYDGVIDLTSPSSKNDSRVRSPELLAVSAEFSRSSRSRLASSPTTSLESHPHNAQPSKAFQSPERIEDVSWLLAGDSDEDGGTLDLTSSPPLPRQNSDVIEVDDDSFLPQASSAIAKKGDPLEVATGVDSSPPIVAKKRRRAAVDSSVDDLSLVVARQHQPLTVDSSVEIVDDSFLASPYDSPIAQSSRTRSRPGDMAPPALPARFTTAAAVLQATPEAAGPSQPVRAAGGRRKRTVTVDSSPLDTSPASQRRLQRLQRRRASPDPSSPQPKRRKHAKRPLDLRALREFVAAEAAHSGDEVSEGSSGEDEPESEGDRRFLQELDATQASPSYNQSLVYRQSLLTQAPGDGTRPCFAGGPMRKGRFGPNRTRPQVMLSSSPARTDDDEPDEYVMGSFVVDDDEEISYEEDHSQL